MAKYIEIGFTDQLDDETMTVDFYVESSSEIPVYNIYNQTTTSTKVKFRWTIDTSTPVIEHVLKHIDDIIARPHLKTIKIDKNSNQPLSNIRDLEKTIRCGFDYVSLIPLDESSLKLSDADFDHLVYHSNIFGDIYFKQHEIVSDNDFSFEYTVQNAFITKSFDNVKPGAEYYGFPCFYLDFPFYKIQKGRSNIAGLYKTWIEQNKSILEEKGIDTSVKSEVAFGQLRFAHYEGDTWELYQTVKLYPYICNISIIEE